jgi:hypothetical protein
MIDFVEKDGRRLPITFSLKVAYHHERLTGRPYLKDVNAIVSALNYANADGDLFLLNLPLAVLADIVYSGFYAAATEKLDFSAADVAEWLLTDGDFSQAVVSAFLQSLPKEGNSDEVAPAPSVQKKTGARRLK